MSSPQPATPDNGLPAFHPGDMFLQLPPGQSAQFTLHAHETGLIQWDISQLGCGSRPILAGETQSITLTLPPTAQPRALIRGHLWLRRTDGTTVQSIVVGGWVKKSGGPASPAPAASRSSSFWLKILAAGLVLILGLGLGGWWYHSQQPTLLVKPAQTSLGTLWYAPPIGGSLETSLVFTVTWKHTSPTDAQPVLIARKELHFSGENSQGSAPEEIFSFPLTSAPQQIHIPLGCYNLSNETVHVAGSISFSLTNSPAFVVPNKTPFDALFKPAPSP